MYIEWIVDKADGDYCYHLVQAKVIQGPLSIDNKQFWNIFTQHSQLFWKYF